MSYINPEINRFWADRGCYLFPDINLGSKHEEDELNIRNWLNYNAFRKIDGKYIARVAYVQPAYIIDENFRQIYLTTYLFDDNKYTEQEALRIIKLAAFL